MRRRPLISKVNLCWKILAVRTLHAENDRRKDKAGEKLGDFLLKLRRWFEKKLVTQRFCRDVP